MSRFDLWSVDGVLKEAPTLRAAEEDEDWDADDWADDDWDDDEDEEEEEEGDDDDDEWDDDDLFD